MPPASTAPGWYLAAGGLPRPYSTRELPGICTPLNSLNDLRPGDIILRSGEHVQLFVRWEDAEHSRYRAIEAAGVTPSPQREYSPLGATRASADSTAKSIERLTAEKNCTYPLCRLTSDTLSFLRRPVGNSLFHDLSIRKLPYRSLSSDLRIRNPLVKYSNHCNNRMFSACVSCRLWCCFVF